MKIASADYLNFTELAQTWASEPDSRPFTLILGRLLKAYWSGDFEALLPETPGHWPLRETTVLALGACNGFPPKALPVEDGGEPNWKELGKVTLGEYPLPGQAVMGVVELPRDMIRLWCLEQGYNLPRHWFPDDKDLKVVGRPSIKGRLVQQMILSAERGKLESTLAAQARALQRWAEVNYGHTHQIPRVRSIENSVRIDYQRLKKQANEAKPH
jgi:hypothetical protein